MDGDRFDSMTRRLATGDMTRRRLIRNLGGTAAGAMLAGLGVRPALAKGGNHGPKGNKGNNGPNSPRGPLGNPNSDGGVCDNCDEVCSNCPIACCAA